MNAVPFDTLKMAQWLESSGFSGPQAAGAAEALAEAVGRAELATKHGVIASEAKVLGAIELLRRDMTIKLGVMVVVSVGVLAALRYLPMHP